MTNPNTKIQEKAIEDIHLLAKKANMCVFMLVDEDLEIYDDECDLTQSEKIDVWERMHEAFMDTYGELLSQVIEDVKSERE
jgi:hypothetical protein